MNLLKFRKPSRYINSEINVIKKPDAVVRFALAFPDIYEVGMSHLGLKILYQIINSAPHASAERVYAPWSDFRGYLKEGGETISSLESSRPLNEFHIVGFSLQYELSYSTILEMLSLGNIPVRSADRGKDHPIVIAGGPCALNPAPLSPFIDAFLIGDGEEALEELIEISVELNSGGGRREGFLKELAKIEGFYLPGYSGSHVKRRFITDLDDAPYPTSPVVPYTQIIHDRVNIEISRGCTRGCRFCQAGMIYRPLRERSPEKILKIAEQTISSTGYDAVSFTSLSAGDYTELVPLMRAFNRSFGNRRISLSLPSLRVASVNEEMLREIKSVKKSGFTMAPEAATERLRSVINKDFSLEDYERALNALFSEGWLNLKLYFMIGLPTERDEDIEAIPQMAMQALKTAKKHTGRYVKITVSISPFVPKPHTPFQWAGQESSARLEEKIRFLRQRLRKKGITLKTHNLQMSMLEAASSRGGREYAGILEEAHSLGSYLEGWSEHFNHNIWEEAMERTGISLSNQSSKSYSKDDPLPWDLVDTGIRKEYLYKDYERALDIKKISDCNIDRCHACGLGCKSGEHLTAGKAKELHSKQIALQRFSPVKVRVSFSKEKVTGYLSHLELTSAILKGLRRAEVPLVYSEGFSPSPRVSFGPPLNVGVGSRNEYLDMDVYPPFNPVSFMERINVALPDGIEFKEMRFIHGKVPSLSSFIAMYEYEISIKSQVAGCKFEALETCDREGVREFIEGFDITEGGRVILTLKDLQRKKVKLSSIASELFGQPLEELDVTRRGLFGLLNGRWITPMELINR